jgi:integrase
MGGIYRRGRTWWGRKQVRGTEHRASLQTTDRRIAEDRYRQWEERLAALAWGGRPRRLFTEAAERFLTEHCATLKPKSARRYAASLKMLGETFAPLYLDQITIETLSEYETWRRASGAAPPTVRRDFACLSSMLTSCEEWGWSEERSNPVPGYLKRRSKRGLKEAPPRTRYLTEEEETRLLAKATPLVRKAIIVAIDTGLRLEEQFSLTWPQVDQRRGMIMTTTRTKSGRARAVPLPERSAQILAQLPRHNPRGRDKVASLYVFHHEDGSRFNNMQKGLEGAARRAGLKDVQWHDLRRTAACRWLQRDGLSMAAVCVLLGHSSVTVTERSYAFLEADALAGAVAQKRAHGGADSTAKRRKNKPVANRTGGL